MTVDASSSIPDTTKSTHLSWRQTLRMRIAECGMGKKVNKSCETKPIPRRVGGRSCRDATSCVSVARAYAATPDDGPVSGRPRPPRHRAKQSQLAWRSVRNKANGGKCQV